MTVDYLCDICSKIIECFKNLIENFLLEEKPYGRREKVLVNSELRCQG